MPKMIKIGEVRVLNHFDLPWTEPSGRPFDPKVGLVEPKVGAYELKVAAFDPFFA